MHEEGESRDQSFSRTVVSGAFPSSLIKLKLIIGPGWPLFHSAIANSLLLNVAESELIAVFFCFFFFNQGGIWFLFLLSCLAALEKAGPQDLCCCQRASCFQR